ncbi:inositol polyphosphate 5-phosphatase OCRL-like [Convolutriloba macropyga]|uniref:inositol polyphosphate 5-phosphatase OCRL-like n=1 Tax=Convolutriloba macropyga TaxID=536237 RepID=UPI003F527F69
MNKYKTKNKRRRPRMPKAFNDLKDMAFVQFRRAKILLVTFNVNGKSMRNVASFQSAVEHSVQFKLIARHKPEIVAICLQECGEVNRVKNFFSEADDLVRHDWGEATKARLSFLDYGLATQCHIGCTFLMVFIRNKLRRLYKLYEKSAVPLGSCCHCACETLRRMSKKSACCILSDKGACVIQFGIQKQTFIVVGVHLASGDHSQRERMKQIETICTKYQQLFLSSHFVFWLGDFNFRTGTSNPIIDDVSFLMLSNREKGGEGIEEKFEAYLSKDQYLMEKAELIRGTKSSTCADSFFQLEEGKIQFPPTYRFRVHEAASINNPNGMVCLPYDLGSRRPSWCDRVFFRDVNGEAKMRVEQYLCHLQSIISDHKPVYALISFDFEFMDVKRFSRDRRTSVDYESYTGQTNTSMPSVDDKQRRHSSTVYSDYYSNTFKTDNYSTVDSRRIESTKSLSMKRMRESVYSCGDWFVGALSQQRQWIEEAVFRAGRARVLKLRDFKENVSL